ncbi:imidazole glycerol phosphate synthase subunit HisH 2 [Ferrigenium kumadai]|uniref:Imidazole glycerol phosphate synthase subunit HisH n=1 Tax=Ferrigenium kumadai TaxID=1682490 RepID=A0AAN1W0R2_9PROT|nr:imidazole glycerol phosphate synthase subunit HisH [Ferrigenium kumadai]BBJ00641.1 imidazole glycerol phosphate synthase subunit HisH 2 [Ferrigenium kumadai]
MITLVDYGLGNIQAFVNIYKRLNIPVTVAQTADALTAAERIILPGVGAFDWAMTRLNESGMRDCLDELVLVKKRPVLGVCVGMQMMARRSDEGKLPGLGWIDAEVVRFDEAGFSQKTHLPHMGWNDVQPRDSSILFNGMTSPRFYFLHSYYFAARNADEVVAWTDYGISFASAVQSGNVFGTQFHPEKSHQWGVQLLKNFAELT